MIAATRRRAQIHTAVFYAAMFGALGAHLPFWPVWLEDWGLSAAEVGLYTSLGVTVRIVAGLAIPVVADRLGQRRLGVVLMCLAGAVIFAAHAVIGSEGALLMGTLATGVVLSGLLPLGEALGTGAAKAHGFAYAIPRALGSVAFLLASLAVGAMIGRMGADAALWWIVVCLLVTAVLGRAHPGAGIRTGAAPPGFTEIGRLLTQPTFALFAVAAAMLLSSHAVLYVYGSVHWRALGLAPGTIGALWAFSVAVEVLVMLALGRALMDRLGPIGALALSGAGGVLRWGAMAFDPPLAALWGLQALHALTFVAGHLGAIAFISAAVPERYGASAQGAFMGLGGGVLTAAAMLLAAAIYPSSGGVAYLIAAGMSAVGLGLTIWLGRIWRGRVLAV